MATSSFDKKIVLDSQKSVDSFMKMVENPAPRPVWDKPLKTEAERKEGVDRLIQMLSR